MKKLLLVLLFFGVSCQQNNDVKSFIDLIPSNPLLIIKNSKDFNNSLVNFNKNLNKLLLKKSDSILDYKLESESLISYHKIGKNEIKPISFRYFNEGYYKNRNIIDSVLYDGYIIKKIGNEEYFYFSTVKNNILIQSESKLLIENSIRNSNLVSKKLDQDLLDLNKISNSNTVLFVSEKLKNFIDNKDLNYFFEINNLSSWFQFDVDLNKNGIILNGVSFQNDSIIRPINYLNGINPSESELLNLVPNNFNDFKSFVFDFKQYMINIEKFESITEIEKIKNDSILFDVKEFAVLSSIKDSLIMVNFKSSESFENLINLNITDSYKYRNFTINKIDNDLFNFNRIKFYNFKSNQKYFTQIENNIIVGNSNEGIENLLSNLSITSTLKNNLDFVQIQNQIPEKSNYLGVTNIEKSKSSTLNELGLSSKDYPYKVNLITLENNFLYNIHTVLKITKNNNVDKINLNGNFKAEFPINFSPKFVTNYITNKKEIIFQDHLNNLYLISLDGELIWKKNIKNKIIGNIHQIDLYKNGRLQFAFSTTKDFQILDKNGNIVKKVEHNNKVGLSIFDYDKVKNYRFFLLGNNLKLINSNMDNVKGFNKKTLKGQFVNSPKHYRIGSKDYLIFNVDNKIIITDRRGDIRIKNNLNNIENEIYLYQNYFTTIDTNNNLIKLDTNGKVSKKPLPLESMYLINANEDNIIYLSENILNINDNIIELKFGNYLKPKLFRTKSKDLISVINKEENKVYMFNSLGEEIKNFPIFGSSSIDFYENKKSKKYITCVGESNEILVYSFN
ncbi:MAG: hypothetical protein ISP56_01915 [Flavobacteriaceae bacterium]|nr:hypothetical protein [Flavobacteriaceae bacterium]